VVSIERAVRKKMEALKRGHSQYTSIGFSGSAASVLAKSYLHAGCVGNSQVKVRVQIGASPELTPRLESGSLNAVIADLRSIDKTENFNIEKLPWTIRKRTPRIPAAEAAQRFVTESVTDAEARASPTHAAKVCRSPRVMVASMVFMAPNSSARATAAGVSF